MLKPLTACTFEKLPDVTPSPEPREEHVAFVREHEMFLYGGEDNFKEEIWVYNMKTSSWKQQKTKNDIPKCVYGSSAWLNDNQIFFVWWV